MHVDHSDKERRSCPSAKEKGGQGERGPQGDHGQDGRPGQEGKVGNDGCVGKEGPIGPIGKTGPTHPYLGRNQTLAIFAFVVVAFLILAYRTENNTNRLDQNVFEACKDRAVITKTIPNCENLR